MKSGDNGPDNPLNNLASMLREVEADFVNPFSGGETGIDVFNHGQDGHGVVPGYRRITVAEHGCTHPTATEANMFRNFANQVFSGQLNEAWPMWSLKTQMVLDECLKAARKVVRS